MNSDFLTLNNTDLNESLLFFVPFKYSKSLWGLVDQNGNQILPPVYQYIHIEHDSSIIVQNMDGQWGYINQRMSFDTNDMPLEMLEKVKAKLHEGRSKKPNEFNKLGFSIASLGYVNKWGVVTEQGETLSFDSEVIEPYVSYNRYEQFDFAARESFWIPVLTESRQLAYVNPQGKIGLRVEESITEEQEELIIKDFSNKELWRQEYPLNSLCQSHFANFNIGAKELHYTEPTVENVQQLVGQLKKKTPTFINLDYDDLGEDSCSETFGVGESLAHVFWGEDFIWAFGSLLESDLPSLGKEYSAYKTTLSSIYGKALSETNASSEDDASNKLDSETAEILEQNEIWSNYDTDGAVWALDDHLLVLYGSYHFDDEAYSTLSLLLLPRSGRPD